MYYHALLVLMPSRISAVGNDFLSMLVTPLALEANLFGILFHLLFKFS
jgi:hypothetical protein